MYYCYVTGGINNVNFHAWLATESIHKLEKDGCVVKKLYEHKYMWTWTTPTYAYGLEVGGILLQLC